MSRVLYGDFCQEISHNLSLILEKTKGINGKLDRVIPFPDQGGSFINQVYLVSTDKDEELVLKVENINWENEKTVNEVLTLKYIDKYTSIPVPKVLAFENVIHHSTLDREYILMTRMRGSPLNHEFERIYANPQLYHALLEQLADILAQLKKMSFSSIGSLKHPNTLQLKNPIDLLHSKCDTACESFSEYAKRWLSYYLQEMKRLKNSGHRNSLYFEKHIPQVETLLNSLYLSRLDRNDEVFFFSHQDFVMKNILIDGISITAVLDWEWSGAAPAEFEAKSGCDFLKTDQDIALFNSMLEQRGVFNFFTPPPQSRLVFYQLIGELYSLISCYEWIEGKLEHSAKFIDQKLEQRRIRSSNNFDMQSYVVNTSDLLNQYFIKMSQELND